MLYYVGRNKSNSKGWIFLKNKKKTKKRSIEKEIFEYFWTKREIRFVTNMDCKIYI